MYEEKCTSDVEYFYILHGSLKNEDLELFNWAFSFKCWVQVFNYTKTWKIHGRFKFIDLLISCYGKWKEENPFYINFGFNIVSMIEHKDWEEDPSHWAQILPKCRPS